MANRKQRRAAAKNEKKTAKSTQEKVTQNVQPDKDNDVLFKLLDAKIKFQLKY